MDATHPMRFPVPILIRNTWTLALLLIFLAGGCSTPGRSNIAGELSTLKPLATFYGKFINQHGGQPPRGEDEFKAFIKEPRNEEWLRLEFQVANIDDMFISPRDKEPYVVIYGAHPHGPWAWRSPRDCLRESGIGRQASGGQRIAGCGRS